MELGAAAPTPRQPPATDFAAKLAEKAAFAAAKGDWGALFVYGTFSLPQTWQALLGRVPDMTAATLRNHARRRVQFGGFAALIEKPHGFVIGHLVTGLKPFERRLLDRAIDDGFELAEVQVRSLGGEPGDGDVDCLTYRWREEFEDALGEHEEEWDVEAFMDEHLDEVMEMCRDLRKTHQLEQLSDEELKETWRESQSRGSNR